MTMEIVLVLVADSEEMPCRRILVELTEGEDEFWNSNKHCRLTAPFFRTMDQGGVQPSLPLVLLHVNEAFIVFLFRRSILPTVAVRSPLPWFWDSRRRGYR